ncbi:MAG: HlyD family type I secretion periplasmic adaptor subunit [Rhodospirillaceae bacterium]
MTDDRSGQAAWHRGVPMSTRWPIRIGLGILIVLVGGFGVWAALAPLSGAVVATGSFVATGQNKMVQHYEGGIIREMAAREGDLVEAGQVLLRMDETEARARLRRLVLKQYRMIAMKARLEVEVEAGGTLAMPAALAAVADDAEARAIFDRQRVELLARRASRAAEELVLEKEIAGIEDSIQGYEAQLKSTRRRVALLNEELADKKQLFDKNLVRKTDLLTLQRTEAGLGGDMGELLGRIADANERVARANQRIVHLRSAAVEAAVEELRRTETELDDVQEQIRAARAVVDRVEVRAPARGIVVKLNYHTSGAVVAPGAVILELLPVRDELVIEARVRPGDVTHVSAGQPALVRLTALNKRITPMVSGSVTYLSADALAERAAPLATDASALRSYYLVRVRLDEADVRARLGEFRPTPGMPADIYIRTGERTFFEYIMKPVLDSFSHAFRES